MRATVVSVNVGLPRNIEYDGRIVSTGIFKTPVNGRVMVGRLGLQGDGQADLTVHGGPQKAVYAYPSEHYEYWQKQLQTRLKYGMFGENLTTQGLLEDSVCIGDSFRAGSVELIVTQPRFPCYKLGIKFGSMDMVKRFLASGRSGFYLAVSKEGDVAAGDLMQLINHDATSPTVTEVFRSDSS